MSMKRASSPDKTQSKASKSHNDLPMEHAAPPRSHPAAILAMQRTVGNQAVSNRLARIRQSQPVQAAESGMSLKQSSPFIQRLEHEDLKALEVFVPMVSPTL